MKYIFLILSLLTAFGMQAQNPIEEILSSVEANNKQLQADRQLTQSDKLAARTGNSLPDPSVTYEYLIGSPEELGKTGELTVSQSFDFPTVYIHKNKLAGIQATRFDQQYAAARQQILLTARELCLDLIYLNLQKELLEQRLKNAEQLSIFYRQRLQAGDANMLETNKIDLELMNIKIESQSNETARQAKIRELTLLNGNIPIEFAGTDYPPVKELLPFQELKARALAADPNLQAAATDRTIARQQISLSKSLWFPKFELGYKHNTGPGEQFNGFVAGISIPLYENRNKIKQAKAQKIYVETRLEDLILQAETGLKNQYEQALALQTSLREYRQILKSQDNLTLLTKALNAGQLSMIEYFVEANTIYQSLQNYYMLENQYQKIIAALYKFEL